MRCKNQNNTHTPKTNPNNNKLLQKQLYIYFASCSATVVLEIRENSAKVLGKMKNIIENSGEMTTHHQNFFSKKIPSWYRISKSVWRLLLHIERKYALFFTTLHLFRNFKEQKKCQNRVFQLNVHTCMWPDLKNCPPSLRAWHSYNPSSWRWTPLMINSETFHLKNKNIIFFFYWLWPKIYMYAQKIANNSWNNLSQEKLQKLLICQDNSVTVYLKV